MTTITIDAEFQSLIPPLSDDERAQLEASILTEGCRDALVCWREGDTLTLVDGHNRYAICQRHGMAFTVFEREFDCREAVVVWMIENQLARRNLTLFARSELALKLKPAIAVLAKANQQATQFGATVPQNFAEPIETRTELGKVADVSRETIRKVEVILDRAPEQIKDMARSGDLKIDHAYRLTKALETAAPEIRTAAVQYGVTDPQLVSLLSSKRDTETVQDVLTSGCLQPGDEHEAIALADASAWDFQGLLRRKEQEYRRAAIETSQRVKLSEIQHYPQGTYSVIYADPPWSYNNTGLYGTAVRHYPTMTTPEICTLLQELELQVADTAVLLLWATNPLLEDALEVVKAWGFRYKTNFVWDKELPTSGLSFYHFAQHELLFLAVRGEQSFLPLVKFNSLFHAAKSAHSEKPRSTYAMIETMYPNQRYIELFARKADERDNWTFWGNEA